MSHRAVFVFLLLVLTGIAIVHGSHDSTVSAASSFETTTSLTTSPSISLETTTSTTTTPATTTTTTKTTTSLLTSPSISLETTTSTTTTPATTTTTTTTKTTTNCGETKFDCETWNGECQPKTNKCTGQLTTGKNYCSKSEECGCCIPPKQGCPIPCPELWVPICATNGMISVTFTNLCFLQAAVKCNPDEANFKWLHDGECANTADSTTSPWTSFETTTTPTPILTPRSCLYMGKLYSENELLPAALTCAGLICNKGKWEPTGDINEYCKTCTLCNDPHFLTYKNVNYDWHGHCNYSITQQGVNQTPSFALYAKFDPCLSGVTGAHCLGELVYKDTDTFAINFGATASQVHYGINLFNISVNGVMHQVDSFETATFLSSINTEPDVLAWRVRYNDYYNCLMILGTRGIMIQYCGWCIYIWAHPTIKGSIYGMCGTITDLSYGLVGRDGTQYDPPINPWPNNTINSTFAMSWQTLDQPDADGCTRNKRQTQESACKANATELDKYKTDCAKVIQNDNSSELIQILIEDCAFDRCVIIQARNENPSANFPEPKEWLNEAGENSKIVADIIKHTVDIRDNRCESKWSGRCFGTQNDLNDYTRCDSLLEKGIGCPKEEERCCVDCSQLTDTCMKKWGHSVARNALNINSPSPCCVIAPGIYELKMGEVGGSGCSCCKYCRRKKFCRRNHGMCITDEDPVHNRTWCLAQKPYGRVKNRGCTGRGCHCCLWNEP